MQSGLQYENLVAVGLVGIEQMLRQHAVKAPMMMALKNRASLCAKAIADVATEMSWCVSCALLLVAMSASDFPGRDPCVPSNSNSIIGCIAYGSFF